MSNTPLAPLYGTLFQVWGYLKYNVTVHQRERTVMCHLHFPGY